jgi:hypothetical protein
MVGKSETSRPTNLNFGQKQLLTPVLENHISADAGSSIQHPRFSGSFYCDFSLWVPLTRSKLGKQPNRAPVSARASTPDKPWNVPYMASKSPSKYGKVDTSDRSDSLSLRIAAYSPVSRESTPGIHQEYIPKTHGGKRRVDRKLEWNSTCIAKITTILMISRVPVNGSMYCGTNERWPLLDRRNQLK